MTTIISDALLPVIGQALEDAIDYRQPVGSCDDCSGAFEGRCSEHIADQERADSYRGVALVLGIRLGT